MHVRQFSPLEAYAYEKARQLADDVLARAREVAVEGGIDVEIGSELVDHGRLVDELVGRAGDVRMIVLEHRRLCGLHRLITGSTVNAVASRAEVPVVSVNSVDPPVAGRGLITAAVQDAREAAERSDLLVIGRRHHLLPMGSHLGPVARAILDNSACPVLVTPEVHQS